MKRFHVHMHVDDLAKNIAFYSQLFGAEPARVESDYAKWMLDEPRVNFAISTRGNKPDWTIWASRWMKLRSWQSSRRAESADMALLDEGTTTCCYARSDKHWITDPQGIAWEHFHSLENIPVFNEAAQSAPKPAPAALLPQWRQPLRLHAVHPKPKLPTPSLAAEAL
jgi:hypothetical protein